jgi:hypothetical protein
MELSFGDRFATLSVLPQESDYATLRIAWRAKMLLSPSNEEMTNFEIKQIGQRIEWNTEKAKDYRPDIPLDDSIITLIRQELVDLDKKKKLIPSTYPIYEKFVLNYQQL